MVWSALSWLFWVQLIFGSRVDLFSFLWGQFLELWPLMSWLQSGHPVVNVFHLVGVSCLQNSSQDTAQIIIYSPWGGAKSPWLCLMTQLLLFCPVDCFPLLLHFLTSLVKLILWIKFFLQTKGRQRTWWERTIGSCFVSCSALIYWRAPLLQVLLLSSRGLSDPRQGWLDKPRGYCPQEHP